MPQASEEQRAIWGGEFGVGEDKAEKYLEEKGYILQGDWTWLTPTPDHQITNEEYSAMRFLIDEWDYGGFITEKKDYQP